MTRHNTLIKLTLEEGFEVLQRIKAALSSYFVVMNGDTESQPM
jgi:hypothetical protein